MQRLHSTSGIAVVIPVYNRASILRETLGYVITQSLLPDTIIIVDDGSTDDTADQMEMWLSEYAGRVEWKVIRKLKSTAAMARNVGFSQIGDAEYVAFLDSDDHWPKDFLERCVQELDAKPHAVAAITERRYRVFLDESTQSSGGLEMSNDPIAWIFKNGGGITSCSLLRSIVVREMAGWPETSPSEDAELFCSMSLRGPWVFAEGKPVTFHMGNAAEINEEVNLSRRYADREVRWAHSLERIYEKLLKLDSSLNTEPLKISMAARWQRAHKYHISMSEWGKARACLVRAIHWHPWRWKYWSRLLKLGFRK